MSNIQLVIPTSAGAGTEENVSQQQLAKTVWYAGGDPGDQTQIQVSDDGTHWANVTPSGSAITGGAWIQGVSTYALYMRLNRVKVGPLGAGAVAYCNAPDQTSSLQTGGSGPAGLGQTIISGNANSKGTTPVATQIADLGAISGANQFELDVTYRNKGICKFTATCAGTVLTVTSVESGALATGQTVSGAGIPAGTTISTLGTGSGGIGTYNLSASATVATAEQMKSVTVACIFTATATTAGAFTATLSNGSGAAGNVLNVSAVASGGLFVGQTVTGAGIPANTTITALGSGTGGTGTYTVSTSAVYIASGIAMKSSSTNGALLTVAASPAPSPGNDIAVGQTLTGAGIAEGTTITALYSGSGGSGTYLISSPATIATGEVMNSYVAGACGSCKLYGTVSNNAGTLTLETTASAIQFYNDDGSLHVGIAANVKLTVATTFVSLSLTGLAATDIDWTWSGVLNFVQ